MDTENAIETLKQTVKEFPDDFKTFIGSISPKMEEEMSKIIQDAKNLADRTVPSIEEIGTAFDNLVGNAREWGSNLISKLISGIKSEAANLKSAVGGIQLAGGVTIADVAGTIPGAFDDVGSSSNTASPVSGTGAQEVSLDGQAVENNQAQYRADKLNRRGI